MDNMGIAQSMGNMCATDRRYVRCRVFLIFRSGTCINNQIILTRKKFVKMKFDRINIRGKYNLFPYVYLDINKTVCCEYKLAFKVHSEMIYELLKSASKNDSLKKFNHP